MSFVTLDFETYYSREYSLTKKDMTTEMYINDPQFEVIGVSLKIDDEETYWFSGTHDEIKEFLLRHVQWEDSALLAHNVLFDGTILAWKFGIVPAFYYDTLCMARGLHSGTTVGGSLAKLVKHYGLGEKGFEVNNALGKHRADFTPDELARYGAYCINDTELTYKLFNEMSKSFPEAEHDLIDITLRMFITPKLYLDKDILEDRLAAANKQKSDLRQGLMVMLKCDNEDDLKKQLGSNVRFGKILESLGVQLPTKTSPTTGLETLAFAKTDVGFIALESHPDPVVQQLCAVRLGTKSTMEESRIQRFIDIGYRCEGLLPIPLKYYGAHTGRWAGADKINLQNLPSRDKEKKALKKSIIAPPGYVIINADSSQIEARILAWLAGQDDVVKAFAYGQDIYCLDAGRIFGREITKANPNERFVGKTMRLGLGYGTGAVKFQNTLRTGQIKVEMELDQCKGIVQQWRRLNPKITEFWTTCQHVLDFLMAFPALGYAHEFGRNKLLKVTPYGILLPNGLYIHYRSLRTVKRPTPGGMRPMNSVMYDSSEGPVYIWGGAMTENIVQALARIVIGEQMVKINKIVPVTLTVHDSIVPIAPASEAEGIVKEIERIMSTAPDWAPGLPLACEIKYAGSYGEC